MTNPFAISVRAEEPILKTAAEAKNVAEKMGYVKTGALSDGQAIYKKADDYITRDIDGNNGGAWKRANSAFNLSSKATRAGTYNVDLSKRVAE
jgi:filamentous hemagglutinin